MRRVGIVLAVALPLAAADLWLKTVRPTAPWAYHERSLAWLALSVLLAAGLALLTRVPSRLVPPTAGVLAGGLLGNALSASWNGMRVPNPLVLEDGRTVVAFNLADVWALAGIALLTATLAVWLVRNRELLATPHEVRTRWRFTPRDRP
jgi:hypothetical protein